MQNREAIADKVFWNCGLDVTTGGVEYRASMFIRTLLCNLQYTGIGETKHHHKDHFNEHMLKEPYELWWQRMKLSEH